MKKIKITLWLCTLVFACFFSKAQDDTPEVPMDSLTDAKFIDLADYLPPLSILIDSAIANSPQVDILEAQIKSQEYQVSVTKKGWTDLVGLSAQYRLSESGIAQVEDGVFFPGSDPDNPGPQSGYIVGVGVRVPLSYLTNRKDRIQVARMNVEIAEMQKEAAKKEVKEEVIRTYNQLLLLQRLIKIGTEAKEFSDLIFQMSEERFKDGELSLDQMGANTGLKAKYATEYETLRTEFSNTYALLERLVGVPLSKLQN
jgi:outer membrane protein TolC